MNSKLIKINGGGKTYKPENYTEFISITSNVSRAKHKKSGEIHLIKKIDNLNHYSGIQLFYYENEIKKMNLIFKVAKQFAGNKEEQPLISQRIVLQKFIKNSEDEYGDSGFIVTNFINGCTLNDLANSSFFMNSDINENRLKYIFKPILTFISMINNNGFYHNDIKGDNIMITNDFNVCIIDYAMMSKDSDGGVYGCHHKYCDISSYLELLDERLGDAIKNNNLGVLFRLLLRGHDPGKKTDSPRDVLAIAALIIYIITGDVDEDDYIVNLSDRLLEKLTRVRSKITDDFYQFLYGLIKNEINYTNVLSHPWLNGSDDPECLKDESGELIDLEGLTRGARGAIRKNKTKKKSKKLRSKNKKSKKNKSKKKKSKKKKSKRRKTTKK